MDLCRSIHGSLTLGWSKRKLVGGMKSSVRSMAQEVAAANLSTAILIFVVLSTAQLLAGVSESWWVDHLCCSIRGSTLGWSKQSRWVDAKKRQVYGARGGSLPISRTQLRRHNFDVEADVTFRPDDPGDDLISELSVSYFDWHLRINRSAML